MDGISLARIDKTHAIINNTIVTLILTPLIIPIKPIKANHP